MLNTRMTVAATLPVDSVWTRKTMRLCRPSSRRPGVVSLCQLVVASPLFVLSLRHTLIVFSRQLVVASPLSLRCPLVILLHWLVVALPLTVLSLRHPLVNSSHRLVVASPLLVLLLRPMPPSRPIVAPAGCCITSRCAALSSSRPLVASAGCRAIISRRRLVAPPSCHLIVLAGCCVACCPCAALSSSRRSPSPSNSVDRCCRHRTPLPPPP